MWYYFHVDSLQKGVIIIIQHDKLYTYFVSCSFEGIEPFVKLQRHYQEQDMTVQPHVWKIGCPRIIIFLCVSDNRSREVTMAIFPLPSQTLIWCPYVVCAEEYHQTCLLHMPLKMLLNEMPLSRQDYRNLVGVLLFKFFMSFAKPVKHFIIILKL